ncbi:MAG: hypothetical protein EOO03_03695, partial [Chitinophagaceae bacterium]
MTKTEAYVILDALAEGCSPFTGELLPDHALLNERKVIRALQMALDALNAAPIKPIVTAEIPEALQQTSVLAIAETIQAAGITPTVSRFSRFLLGSKQFTHPEITAHHLFGSIKNQFTYADLQLLVSSQVANDPVLQAA